MDYTSIEKVLPLLLNDIKAILNTAGIPFPPGIQKEQLFVRMYTRMSWELLAYQTAARIPKLALRGADALTSIPLGEMLMRDLWVIMEYNSQRNEILSGKQLEKLRPLLEWKEPT